MNKEIYPVNLRIQSACAKIQTRKTPNTDTFHAVFAMKVTVTRANTQRFIQENFNEKIHLYSFTDFCNWVIFRYLPRFCFRESRQVINIYCIEYTSSGQLIHVL